MPSCRWSPASFSLLERSRKLRSYRLALAEEWSDGMRWCCLVEENSLYLHVPRLTINLISCGCSAGVGTGRTKVNTHFFQASPPMTSSDGLAQVLCKVKWGKVNNEAKAPCLDLVLLQPPCRHTPPFCISFARAQPPYSHRIARPLLPFENTPYPTCA
jgi:hypothetical protein